jgi:hypothetical protein
VGFFHVKRASEDPAAFEKFKDVLVGQLAQLRDIEEVEDPLYVKGKGRPRNKRLKGATEPKERVRVKCGKCGKEGHNARTCL